VNSALLVIAFSAMTVLPARFRWAVSPTVIRRSLQVADDTLLSGTPSVVISAVDFKVSRACRSLRAWSARDRRRGDLARRKRASIPRS
jgi:hypothetical protein